jgi:hypothetical protein
MKLVVRRMHSPLLKMRNFSRKVTIQLWGKEVCDFREAKSKGLLLQGLWYENHLFFCLTRRPVLWTLKVNIRSRKLWTS